MYSLRKIQPGKGLSLTETTAPTAPGPGEVLLRVSSAGVCGTDLHIDCLLYISDAPDDTPCGGLGGPRLIT